MAMTRGRARVFYADGTIHDVQVLGVDRLRAEREKAKAGVEEQVWYRVYLAAERAGLPGAATFDGWMGEVVDFDMLMTTEQIDAAFASGQLSEDQADAAREQIAEEESGESPATLRSLPVSPSAPASPSATSATYSE